MNRRELLVSAAVAGVAATVRSASAQTPAPQRYPIGVCDWMILKRQRLGAFPLARDIGVDGVELDMGSLGDRETFENALADPQVREQFRAAAAEHGLAICSLAMSGFYAQSFAERPTVPRMLADCLDTMTELDVKVAFLPLGVRSDLVARPELREAVVQRLRAVAPRAEDAGQIIGLETALDAAGEAALLDEIDSPAIRSYFNFSNPLQAGRDLLAELRTLGAERICQIHATDQDGVLLEHNQRLDMESVRETLEGLGWHGWLVLERSRDASDARNVRGNYGANAAFLKRIFQAR